MPAFVEQLEQLVVGDPEFSKLEAKLGRFCLFEAMNVVHGEVRLGNFLAAFLDPAGSHGYGPSVLRTLVMEALRAGQSHGVQTAGLSPLHAHIMAFERAEIVREFRHIDILVKLRQLNIAIAIELKIGSTQGPGQLAGYRSVMEQEFPNWRKLYIFLTVEDEEPADAEWIPLRYAQLVPAFEKLDGSGAASAAIEAFRAFIEMLKRHHVTDQQLEEIANGLWSRHKEALNFLMERRPDRLRGVLQTMAAEANLIIADLNKSGNFTFDASEPQTANILKFACLDWESLPHFKSGSGWTDSGRILLFEIKREGDEINAYLYLGPCSAEVRQTVALALLQGRKITKGRWLLIANEELYSERTGEIVDIQPVVTRNFARFCQSAAARFTPLLNRALNDLPRQPPASVENAVVHATAAISD